LVVTLGQQLDLSQHSVFAFSLVLLFPTPANTASEVANATKAMIAPFFILKKLNCYRQYYLLLYDFEILE
jgi:hypothetical protein